MPLANVSTVVERNRVEILMILHYELWDMESANQIAVFESKGEALKLVAEYLRLNGADAIEPLVVGAIYRDGNESVSMIPVLDGHDFLAIARAASKLDLAS
jgi:hypothetical protein